jgi:hypothetical protein
MTTRKIRDTDIIYSAVSNDGEIATLPCAVDIVDGVV